MKHLLVFVCFWVVEDIIQSFNSIYTEDIDYFIVENKSPRSNEIEEFFKTKKLKGYIQFEKNILYNTLNIFNQDFRSLLNEYDVITYTDCDLYFENINDTFKEILTNLDQPRVMVSSADVFLGNHYDIEPKERIIGIDKFKEIMSKRIQEPGSIEKMTGLVLMTLKKESLFTILNSPDLHFRVTGVDRVMTENGGIWVHTRKNLAYHLAWDHYTSNDEYGVWKKKEFEGKTSEEFWNRQEFSNYRIIGQETNEGV